MKKYTTITILFFSSLAMPKENFNTIYQADLPNKAVEISYNDNGQILQVTTNHWIDRVKTKQGQKYFTFEQGYNYQKKQGFTRVYDDKKVLKEERWNKSIDGIVVQEELLLAFDLFKKNKIVQKHFKETNLQITIHGGFNFEDNKECKLGNRCVHVFASTANVAILAHSIVRLVDSKVIYPDYDMNKSVWKNGHANNKF